MPKSSRPLGPSFDCKNANSPPERLLCRDEELMHLDALMGQLYRMVRKREGSGSSALLTAQRGCRPARSRPTAEMFLLQARLNSRKLYMLPTLVPHAVSRQTNHHTSRCRTRIMDMEGPVGRTRDEIGRSPVARGSDELSRVGHR